MKNICQKIQLIKKRVQESNIKKSGHNKFANFKYYELQDFVPTIVNLCNEFGLYTEFDFTASEGILRIVDIDNMDAQREIRVPMAKADIKGCNEIQSLGGSITYLKRYLFMNAFDITENDQFDCQIAKKDYFCKDCNAKIEDVMHNGKKITAEYLYARSKETFGKPLCNACRKKGEF